MMNSGFVSMLKSKIHRATVTQADLNYEGSLTLDDTLLQAAGILPFEEIHVWNVTRGTRFRTYAMRAPAGSQVVCVNGAATHLAITGDLIIVATYGWMPHTEALRHIPTVVFVDPENRLVSRRQEIPGPALPLPV